MKASTVLSFVSLLFQGKYALGHGYLKSPRSRNYLAWEDGVYWGGGDQDPDKEDCPHCLNRGGTLARCGMTDERNYDYPKNYNGGPFQQVIETTYQEGDEIVFEAVLTAHHMGHFTFKACPIQPGEVASQSCFDAHPLEFVQDLRYNAPKDNAFPGRAYIAPISMRQIDDSGPISGMGFTYKFKLPDGVYGENVLIQWHYLTANSCSHEGYSDYAFPDPSWQPSNTAICDPIPPDGNGVPEQFWNCAEVRILPKNPDQNPITSPPTMAHSPTTQPVSPAPTTAPTTASPTSVVTPAPTPSQSNDKIVTAYYASWQYYDRGGLAKPENLDFSKIDRVNFAFFQTDVNGMLWGTDAWIDPVVLFGPQNYNPSPGEAQYCSWDGPGIKNCASRFVEKGIISRIHATGGTIYPSIGGWTLSSAFPAMAASPAARTMFAKQCKQLVLDYDFDGIDIDWEYPGYADHNGTPEDKDNFTLLLQLVRAELDTLYPLTGKRYGLTAALPCGPSNIENIDVEMVSAILDETLLMSYDLHGAWDSVTGLHSPLYYQGFGNPELSVQSCVQKWNERGAPMSKISVGLGFYGRSFAGATGLNEQFSGSDLNNWGMDEGIPQYYNIASEIESGAMTSVYHDESQTPYAYFNDGSGFVSYDNERSICKKTEFVIQNGLNGFLIWELSGDLMDDLSTPLLDSVNNKLANPEYPCEHSQTMPPTTTPKTMPPTAVPNTKSPTMPPTSSPLTKAPTQWPTPEPTFSAVSPTIPPVLTPSPTPAPTTSQPQGPTPMSCPDGFTGLRPADACTKYYHCVNGVVIGDKLPCSAGTLFDVRYSNCNWADQVTCDSGRIRRYLRRAQRD